MPANGVRDPRLSVGVEVTQMALVKRRGDGPDAPVYEIVGFDGGVPSRILFRRRGLDAPEAYSNLEDRDLFKMRMDVGGNSGEAVYAAGEIVEVSLDHAKTVFLLGHGRPLDDAEKLIPLKRAAQMLGVNEDDIGRAHPDVAAKLAEKG